MQASSPKEFCILVAPAVRGAPLEASDCGAGASHGCHASHPGVSGARPYSRPAIVAERPENQSGRGSGADKAVQVDDPDSPAASQRWRAETAVRGRCAACVYLSTAKIRCGIACAGSGAPAGAPPPVRAHKRQRARRLTRNGDDAQGRKTKVVITVHCQTRSDNRARLARIWLPGSVRASRDTAAWLFAVALATR